MTNSMKVLAQLLLMFWNSHLLFVLLHNAIAVQHIVQPVSGQLFFLEVFPRVAFSKQS